MGAIAGILDLAGGAVARGTIHGMLRSMEHRSPDGLCVEVAGEIGLGQGHRYNLEEPRRSSLGSGHGTRQGWVVCDARLDERVTLARALGVGAATHTTDAELILAAFERWGDACVDHLLGDFAFAIWDARLRRLFCARDAVGARPFIYGHVPGKGFVFGSEIKALHASGRLSAAVDDERLGDFLAGVCTGHDDTFFQELRRLPPGHRLTVAAGSLAVERYWQLDPTRDLMLASDEEYADCFLEAFERAVKCRCRSGKSVGIFLSGGLDSSAIAAVADQDPWVSLTATSDAYAACDERQYVAQTLHGRRFAGHCVDGDGLDPLGSVEAMLRFHDEPFFAPGAPVSWALHRRAAELGVGVIFSGHGGDEVVSQGFGYPKQLALEGRWLTLARELRGFSRLYGESYLGLLWAYGSRYSRLLRGVARRCSRPAGGEAGFSWEQLLAPEFVEASGLRDRVQEYQRSQASYRSERERHLLDLTQPVQAQALEILDQNAAAFSSRLETPFWDRRLVELCLSLPTAQKVERGLGRQVLRRAMRGRVPADILSRRDKTDFLPRLRAGLHGDRGGFLESLVLEPSEFAHKYFSSDAVLGLYRRFRVQPQACTPAEVYAIWQFAVLALWLRQGPGPDSLLSPQGTCAQEQ